MKIFFFVRLKSQAKIRLFAGQTFSYGMAILKTILSALLICKQKVFVQTQKQSVSWIVSRIRKHASASQGIPSKHSLFL